MNLEDTRAWYDAIDFGVLAKNAPLQAAVLSDAVQLKPKNISTFDDNIRAISKEPVMPKDTLHSMPIIDHSQSTSLLVESITTRVLDTLLLTSFPDEAHETTNIPQQYSLLPSSTHPPGMKSLYPSTIAEIDQFVSDIEICFDSISTPDGHATSRKPDNHNNSNNNGSQNNHCNTNICDPNKRTKTANTTVSVGCQTNPLRPTPSSSSFSSSSSSSSPLRPQSFKPPSFPSSSSAQSKSQSHHHLPRPQQPHPNPQQVPQSKKKNPFLSAKDQFISDGGKFKEPPAAEPAQAQAHAQRDGKQPSSTLPPELQQYDVQLVDKIRSEILQDTGKRPVSFQDIAGLEFAKKSVQEIICWPMMRPDLFTGLRALPKGLLLFGPPGTGKTLLGKAIAHQTGATFFSISASSLTSKWVGESEGLVRVLFAVAAYHQPSVVFIDEVDSLLTQRSSDESEASRRIKTEFLVQLDGAGGGGTSNSSSNSSSSGEGCAEDGPRYKEDARVVVIGATNRPDELDEAARRRFAKRLYIPLPNEAGRQQLIEHLLGSIPHGITAEDQQRIVHETAGYSGADLKNLCTEASLGPVRDIAATSIHFMDIQASDVPPIAMGHFSDALLSVGASVSTSDLDRYIQWNATFGTYRRME